MLRKHAIEINAVVLGLRQECVGHSWPRQISAPLLFCPTLAHLNNRAETREGSSGGCRWMQEVFCWTAWTVTSDWCFWPQKHSLLGIMCFREEQRRTDGLQDREREWRPQKHCTYTGQEVFNTHIKCYVITVFYCSRVTFSQQTAMWFYSWDHSVRSSNGDWISCISDVSPEKKTPMISYRSQYELRHFSSFSRNQMIWAALHVHVIDCMSTIDSFGSILSSLKER